MREWPLTDDEITHAAAIADPCARGKPLVSGAARVVLSGAGDWLRQVKC